VAAIDDVETALRALYFAVAMFHVPATEQESRDPAGDLIRRSDDVARLREVLAGLMNDYFNDLPGGRKRRFGAPQPN
jgi:flagellar biosynthesis regulator FlbT